jgi:hypothetical protein
LSAVIEPVVTVHGPVNVVEVIIRIEVHNVPSIGVTTPHLHARVSVHDVFNWCGFIHPPLANRYGVSFAWQVIPVPGIPGDSSAVLVLIVVVWLSVVPVGRSIPHVVFIDPVPFAFSYPLVGGTDPVCTFRVVNES